MESSRPSTGESLASAMGWAELEDEMLHSSQESWQSIHEADIYRTPSDPGDSADESAGTPLSQGTEQAWWVEQLLQHTQNYRYKDPAQTSVKLLSGCSGMAAEAFALQEPHIQ